MMQLPSTDILSSSGSSSGLGLSAQDVARLISEDSAGARIDVMEKVAQEYGERGLNEREQEIAQQIFRILMHDTELKVRAALAGTIKLDDSIPRDIVLHMAQDVEEVALPMIQYSEVLSDADLIKIVRESELVSRQTAVAKRRHVAPTVSSALVDTGKAEVVTTLVSNEGAKISQEKYQTIIETFPSDERVVTALVERGSLPVTLAEKLIHTASGKMGEALRKRYNLGSNQVDTERTRELATLKLVEGNISGEELEKLVEQMSAHGRLTPSLILTALCRGNLEFFEAAVARLAGIPTRNARLLVRDKGDLGFKALYEKAQLPESLVHATRVVLSALTELGPKGGGGRQFANRLVERVLARAEGQEIENLSYIIALIRQNNVH